MNLYPVTDMVVELALASETMSQTRQGWSANCILFVPSSQTTMQYFFSGYQSYLII